MPDSEEKPTATTPRQAPQSKVPDGMETQSPHAPPRAGTIRAAGPRYLDLRRSAAGVSVCRVRLRALGATGVQAPHPGTLHRPAGRSVRLVFERGDWAGHRGSEIPFQRSDNSCRRRDGTVRPRPDLVAEPLGTGYKQRYRRRRGDQ